MEYVLVECVDSGQFILDVPRGVKSFRLPRKPSPQLSGAEQSVPAWAKGHRFRWLGQIDILMGLRIFEADN